MATESNTARSAAQPGHVAGKAFLRAGARLSLSQKDLGAIVGLSPATISRLAAGSFELDPRSKSFELALLFLRAYRGLDALVGGDDDKARAWFHADNDHVRGVPAERVTTIEGLAEVTRYLDAMRGRL